MKKFNIILLLLCCLTSVGYAQVAVGNKAEPEEGIQSKGYEVPTGYTFHRGDTIIIDKNQETYLTGEKMSIWVYDVPHLIQRVGGRHFPNGLLIQGINSWIAPSAAKTLHPVQPSKQDGTTPVVVTPQPIVTVSSDTTAAQQPATSETSTISATSTASGTTAASTTVADSAAVEDSIKAAQMVAAERQQYIEDSIAQEAYAPKYQANRFSIGVRGGVAEMLHGSNVMSNTIGWDALLDFQYAHYWKDGSKPAVGLLFGASFGFMRGGMKGSRDTTSFVANTDCGTINYTVTAKEIKEVQDQLMLEIPIMFTMVTDKGFFLNLGPRLSFPVWSRSTVTLTEPNINAYFIEEGVMVSNELITGKITNEQNPATVAWNKPILNVLVGAELGYEYKFRNGNALGIGVYGNYGVYSLYNRNEKANAVISIVSPSNEAQPAAISVLSPSDIFTSKLGMFDVGIKLVFHFHKQRFSL